MAGPRSAASAALIGRTSASTTQMASTAERAEGRTAMSDPSTRHSRDDLTVAVLRALNKGRRNDELLDGRDFNKAYWDAADDSLNALLEQFDAMRDKLDSLYAGYSAKCERFSLGTCDRSADDGQLCRICQFFLGIGWESFEVTSGGLRSWRPVSNPASRDEA